MTIPNPLRNLLGVGLLFGAGLAVRADDTVTFQVDLSSYTNGAGQQAATLVDVRGAFNGWGAGSTLENNGANVYTNTFPVVGNTGDKFQYKFTFTTPIGVTWEDNNPPPGAGQPPDEGNNRVLALVGGVQILPVVPFYAPSVTLPIELPTNRITYRVDMTEQVQIGNFLPPGDTIRVTGAPAALTGWQAGIDMTNNPALSGDASNIYSAVVEIQGIPGALGGAHKFRMNNQWEDTEDGADRNFTIIGGDQVLPVRFYNDQPVGPATNANVTFQVDMTPQVITGGFTNGVSQVTISGNITGWGNGAALTNDPALSGNASNVYSATISTTTTVGMWCRYKFRADGGWEAAEIYGVGQNKDRRFYYTGGDQVLPLVTYNDASLCDLLQQPTAITFVVHLANGTLDNNGIPFDRANDTVWINGPMINPSWAVWNTNECVQVTNNPVGSDFYEQTIVVAAGSPRRQLYKFGLDGPGHGFLDNENPVYSDHIKYVRDNNPSYRLPAAEFGNLQLATLVEPAFGDLKVGAPAGGTVPITWLGGACTTLQTRTNLSVGSWIDVPATDATSSTNWPITGVQQYFRLQRRPLP